MFHGGDYNPDQWTHVPGTVDEDFRLFKIAGVNTVSIGIFAWATLEPEEGKFDFSFLDDIFARAEAAGTAVILATPTGAKPNWMAQKYPEIRRVLCAAGPRPITPVRMEQGARHNHCPTSPVYREKARIINRKLAERYGKSPALAMWHVSNEYNNAQCECELCRAAWREWLKRKYGSLKALNEAWWSAFWSHTFTDWSQINGADWTVPGMVLDRRRFDTDQMIDFYLAESAPLRELTPGIPLTANAMGTFEGLDYWKWAKVVDVFSWDAYPIYDGSAEAAARTAPFFSFQHDLNRSHKDGAPFLLMESAPGITTWREKNMRVPRPGVHALKSMQAVAHGSDGVCYFQMRKGRGGCEQFHSAVIDHKGDESTRLFREVAQVGAELARLAPLLGATTPARVGIIFDWENRWTLRTTFGITEHAKDNERVCLDHYIPFWNRGIPVDILNGDSDLSKYSLVIAPELFMLREGFGARVEKFVAAGGTFVATYLTGIVDETTLAFTGGFPGPLKKVLGIWMEETDFPRPDERNTVTFSANGREHEVAHICEVIHAEGAEVMATFGRDYYAGQPAVTRNKFGKGEAWYVGAAQPVDTISLLEDIYEQILSSSARGIVPTLPRTKLPPGVTAQIRENENGRFVFVMNFNNTPVKVEMPDNHELLTGSPLPDLPAYGYSILKTITG